MEQGILLLIVLIIMGWVLIFYLDKKRIRSYLAKRGEAVTDITWKIFGKGWFFESGKEGGGNRIYKITFKDFYGNTKSAWCKTAMLSGVFISDEVIIKQAKIQGREMTDAEKVVLLEDELRKFKS